MDIIIDGKSKVSQSKVHVNNASTVLHEDDMYDAPSFSHHPCLATPKSILGYPVDQYVISHAGSWG